MTCPDAGRLQACFDAELDAPETAELRRHAATCAHCGAWFEEAARARTLLRRALPPVPAPPELRATIRQALDREAAASRNAVARPRAGWRSRSFWAGAASGLGVAAAVLAGVLLLDSVRFASSLPRELLAAHLQSLRAEHLYAVASTDRHTVKPWFAARTEVSPAVADFAAQGYALLGGRVDPLAGHRAAVTVYRHGLHYINVFSWAADRRRLPDDTTRDGFHLAFWRVDDVAYCAVSDAGWSELLGLERLLRETAAREARPAAGAGE